ncbi:hypothetical protein BDN70DRAFT_249595 [Pholiota conissans]|uniref:F-box domain-containing protein n=1 Tax=Pholiota conissans TaxID=109636 RepID=A0A9P5YUQ7_9AGAR|nr:hypothetical protein BDN70DRAFT_249595 [Pholiota conissans]
MAINLLDIPEELHIHILSYLDAFSLIHCAMTNKSLYKTFKTSSQLEYVVQLHLDGLEGTGTRGTQSYSELISRLLRRRQAWILPEWNQMTTIHMQYENHAYELIGDVFMNSDRHQHLETVWLPTSNRQNVLRVDRALHGMEARDMTMDPTQDVVVILDSEGEIPLSVTTPRTIRLHIRTISTHDVHPLARLSTLECFVYPCLSGNTIRKPRLQIEGNTLLVSFCSSAASYQMRALIWDWTTSELLLVCQLITFSFFTDLTTLQDSSKPTFDPMLSFLIYEITLLNSMFFYVNMLSDSGSIQIFKLAESRSISDPPIHLATLRLPPTHHNINIRFSSHTGPIAVHGLPHESPVIQVNARGRLHVFNMIYSSYSDRAFMLLNTFLHQHILLTYCEKGERRGAGPPLDIPWDTWGPPNTRIIQRARTQANWSRYVHGQRVVLQGREANYDGEDRLNYVEVLDFSPAAVSSVGCSSLMSLSSNRFSKVQRGVFLVNDLETHLPCVSTVRDLRRSYLWYMINVDSIVCAWMNDKESISLNVYTI